MTSKEFVIWLKGFVAATHNYNVSPKQWDELKDVLGTVDDSIPLGGLISDHNMFGIHQPFPIWQHPHTTNPYFVGDIPSTIEPSPILNPNGTSQSLSGSIGFQTGSSSIGVLNIRNWDSTSTTYGYPSGSAWSYTSRATTPPYTTGDGMD